MTQSMYLVTVSQPQIGARLVNDVTAVLVNASGTSNAKLNAALAANAAFQSTAGAEVKGLQDSFPSTYFDTAVIVSSSGGVPGSGNGSAAGDAFVHAGPAQAPQYVDHTVYTPV